MSEDPGSNRRDPSNQRCGPTILIADDHDDSLFMLRTLLEMKGYRVAEARDANRVIELAQSETPDLILLDWVLPDSDGGLVMRQLRRSSKTRNVPIVLVSGWDAHELDEATRSTAATEYLVKLCPRSFQVPPPKKPIPRRSCVSPEARVIRAVQAACVRRDTYSRISIA
ncbi:MAG: response regulator [Pyrinomonadaceae bacterium]